MRITKNDMIKDQNYVLDNDAIAIIINKEGVISIYNPKADDEDQPIEQQMFFIKMITVLHPSWLLQAVMMIEIGLSFIVALFSRKGKK